ncbi:hypothetical protein [Actinoplanes sp. NPDC048796]|uniref:hypothetical protein n=1 Tax=Actinoplanes sp. NPDC048796 TaxID=3155640 RepID=UPI0033C86CE4
MERGPLALFGAIIAVGLGPALWMGVQLGTMPTSPGRAPAVITDQNRVTNDQLVGGTGAGEATTDNSPVDTEPQVNVLPRNTSPSAEPTPSATTTSPTPSPKVATPSETSSPTPTTSAPTPPPTEATTTPADTGTEPTATPPTDDTTPPADDESDDPTWPPNPAENADHDSGGGTGWDGADKGDRTDSRIAAPPAK